MSMTGQEMDALSIDAVVGELEDKVYAACGMIEALERLPSGSRIRGNAHDLRQKMAVACGEILRERMEVEKHAEEVS